MPTLMWALLLTSATPDWEDRLVAWGLEQHHREQDPSPEGKPIEEVLFASENVFAEGDVFPTRWNKVHWKTREKVTRRELLLGEGDAWSEERVIETERIMRSLQLWSVVRIVAAKGRGGVAMLVITQDRW